MGSGLSTNLLFPLLCLALLAGALTGLSEFVSSLIAASRGEDVALVRLQPSTQPRTHARTHARSHAPSSQPVQAWMKSPKRWPPSAGESCPAVSVLNISCQEQA